MLGIKDLDKYVLDKLDDRSLFNICQTNKKYSELCQDDLFWKKRAESRFFPQYIKRKSKDKSWKSFYLNSIYINWKHLIYKIFKNVVFDKKISINAVQYLIKIFSPLYEKIIEIPLFDFRIHLKKLIGESLEIDAYSELLSDEGYFSKTYDKRKILEYLLAEVIELSYMNKVNEILRDTDIKSFLRKNGEFQFLLL